jgi:hypothetical protein
MPSDFTFRQFGALDLDQSDLAPIPNIAAHEFYTGHKGTFSKLQDEAAESRLKERDLRKRLLLEREQIKQDLKDKDQDIKELDFLENLNYQDKDEQIVQSPQVDNDGDTVKSIVDQEALKDSKLNACFCCERCLH